MGCYAGLVTGVTGGDGFPYYEGLARRRWIA
jgi:hypothetical protein